MSEVDAKSTIQVFIQRWNPGAVNSPGSVAYRGASGSKIWKVRKLRAVQATKGSSDKRQAHRPSRHARARPSGGNVRKLRFAKATIASNLATANSAPSGRNRVA